MLNLFFSKCNKVQYFFPSAIFFKINEQLCHRLSEFIPNLIACNNFTNMLMSNIKGSEKDVVMFNKLLLEFNTYKNN